MAIKSGWDQYGISFARPSTNIIIRRLVGETRSSGIAIGSEMSGGVSEVHAEDLRFSNSRQGVRIKTALGRGGYVRNVYISTMFLSDVQTAIRFSGLYGEHPDDDYDRNALPVIEKLTFRDIIGENIGLAGLMEGIEGDNFRDICFYNVSLEAKKKSPWRCSNVEGYSGLVSPEPCEPLRKEIEADRSSECYLLPVDLRVTQIRDDGAQLASW